MAKHEKHHFFFFFKLVYGTIMLYEKSYCSSGVDAAAGECPR